MDGCTIEAPSHLRVRLNGTLLRSVLVVARASDLISRRPRRAASRRVAPRRGRASRAPMTSVSLSARFAAFASAHAVFLSTPATSLSPAVVVVFAGTAIVVFLLLILASLLDGLAATKLHAALQESPDVRLIARVQARKGAAFLVDRRLDGVAAAAEVAAELDAARARARPSARRTTPTPPRGRAPRRCGPWRGGRSWRRS